MGSLYDSLPVAAQNLACTWAGYRRARLRYTPHFHDTLRAWNASVHAPLEALHAIQWKRLERLLQHARAHVPHYRDVPPPSNERDPATAIRETLAALPTLSKSSYRNAPESFLASNLPVRGLIRGKTSGTTGSALPLWWTPETLAEEFACIWRLYTSRGVGLDAPRLTFNGQLLVPFRQQTPPFWRRNHWSRQTLFSLYHASAQNLPAYVDAVHATPARFAQGYPSALYLVARALLDAGRPLPRGRLAACFTSSESLLAYQRDVIEEAFGAPVFDRYGVSELCVSMTQCEQRRLHADMEFCIVELEVEETGADWERGPLLATGLATDATPLFRYRVGDVGTRAKSPCPCGRAGDSYLDVDGRIEDYVVTPDGRAVGRMDHVFKEQLDVAEAQLLQETPDALEVLVVRRASYDEDSERGLLKEFRMRLGDEIRIDLRYVDAIAREANGKFRAVKSRVGRINP